MKNMLASISPSVLRIGIMPAVVVYFRVLPPTWISWCVTTGGGSAESFLGSAAAGLAGWLDDGAEDCGSGRPCCGRPCRGSWAVANRTAQELIRTRHATRRRVIGTPWK